VEGEEYGSQLGRGGCRKPPACCLRVSTTSSEEQKKLGGYKKGKFQSSLSNGLTDRANIHEKRGTTELKVSIITWAEILQKLCEQKKKNGANGTADSTKSDDFRAQGLP